MVAYLFRNGSDVMMFSKILPNSHINTAIEDFVKKLLLQHFSKAALNAQRATTRATSQATKLSLVATTHTWNYKNLKYCRLSLEKFCRLSLESCGYTFCDFHYFCERIFWRDTTSDNFVACRSRCRSLCIHTQTQINCY